MLLPRVLTAVIGIPLILAAIYLGNIAFVIFVWGVSLLCLYEAYDLFAKMDWPPRRCIGFLLGGLLFIVFIAPSSVEPQYLLPLKNPPVAPLALTMAVVILILWELFHVKSRSLKRSGATLFAILLIIWPLAHLVVLRDLAPLGKSWCYFLFITIWISDCVSYFVGKAWGERKLAPNISPKKTTEGFLGGILGAVAVGSVLWIMFFREEGFTWREMAMLAVAISLIGQLSDLVESLLKREAGVKDSSDILPGHGGFLDRFDSFILTAPLLYYYAAFR